MLSHSQIRYRFMHIKTNMHVPLIVRPSCLAAGRHTMPWPTGWQMHGRWRAPTLWSSCAATRRTWMQTERWLSWRLHALLRRMVSVCSVFSPLTFYYLNNFFLALSAVSPSVCFFPFSPLPTQSWCSSRPARLRVRTWRRGFWSALALSSTK